MSECPVREAIDGTDLTDTIVGGAGICDQTRVLNPAPLPAMTESVLHNPGPPPLLLDGGGNPIPPPEEPGEPGPGPGPGEPPVEPPPEPNINLELEFDECVSEFTLRWTSTEPFESPLEFHLEYSNSVAGPWSLFVNLLQFVNTVGGESHVTVNNQFDGMKVFRVTVWDGAEMVGFSNVVHPPPSAVDAPVITFTNEGAPFPWPLTTSPYGLPSPGNEDLNPFLSATEVIMAATQRFEIDRFQVTQTGANTLVTMSGPPGAVIRFTVDGTEPTSLSPLYVAPIGGLTSTFLSGLYMLQWRAKCFLGDCESPVTTALTDLVYPTSGLINSTSAAQSASQACDLPRVVPPDMAESGASCNVLYGGPDNFVEIATNGICGSLQVNMGVGGGPPILVWRGILNTHIGNPNLNFGFPPFIVDVSWHELQDISFFRTAAWNTVQPVFTNLRIQSSYLEGGFFGGPSGSAVVLDAAIRAHVLPQVQTCFHAGELSIADARLVFTAANDFGHLF